MPPRKSSKGPSKSPAKKTKRSGPSAKKQPDAKSRLQQAQKLVAKALRCGDCNEEVRLASDALQLSQDCAEAYLILAQHAFHAIDALPFFEQAREAGARQLGAAFFKKERGNFWTKAATRPYMQASGGFAECLWSVGRRDEAFAIWRELLELDRHDHQGARQVLQVTLLETQRTAEVVELLQQYKEESAWWSFNWLLASFQQTGDTESNRKLLKQVRKLNRHVVPYLLKDKLPKEELKKEPKPGSAEEATIYITSAAAAWWQTPGAITWLRQAAAQKAPMVPVVQPVVGPTEESKGRLRELPQTYGLVYQAAVHQFPNWTNHGEQTVRPWVIVMVNGDTRLIVTQEILMQRPSTESVWDRLDQGLRMPFAGKQVRPSEIQAYEHPVWDELRPHFQEIGIDIIYRKPVDEIDYILSQLQPMFSGGPPESDLLNAPGVTEKLVGDFYKSAAAYFRQAPWQYCSEDRPLEVRFPDEPDRVRYAVVTGQGGDQYGLVLHDDVQSVYDGWDETDDASLESVTVSMQFGEQAELTAVDVDAIERNAWPVATPEAYPTILRTDPETMYSPPTSEDLRRIEICLQAIPEFARRHHREKDAAETLTVSAETDSLLKRPARKTTRKNSKVASKEVYLAWFSDANTSHDHDHDHDHDGCEVVSCSHHDHDD